MLRKLEKIYFPYRINIYTIIIIDICHLSIVFECFERSYLFISFIDKINFIIDKIRYHNSINLKNISLQILYYSLINY